MNKLVKAIKKKPAEAYDPEVNALVQTASLVEGQTAADKMFTAAGDLSAAREALDTARLGQHQHHIKWRDFLASAVQRWQEYTQDFQRQEAEYAEIIEQAKTAIASAHQRFEESKVTLTAEEIALATATVGDEPMAERPKGEGVGKTLKEGLETMQANLITLKSSADAMLADEQALKRQRTDNGDGLNATSMPSSAGLVSPGNALTPFANREGHQSFQQPDKM